MKKTLILALTLALLLSGCAYRPAPPTAPDFLERDSWIQAKELGLLDEHGEPFRINSVCLGIEDVRDAASLPLDDMYADIASLGFNTVELQMGYQDLCGSGDELVSSAELKAVDLHLAAAEAQELYVILNIYTVPEGQNVYAYQDEAEQERLVKIWEALAGYYSWQSQIIGYSMLDEPLMAAFSAEAAYDGWCSLAERIATAIRQEDARHLIFAEQTRHQYLDKATGGLVSYEPPNLGFPTLNVSGLVLQFQYFQPYSFLTQPYSDPEDTPYLVYPSSFYAGMRTESGTVLTKNNEPLDLTINEWQELRSEKFKVSDPDIKYVRPCVSIWSMGSGEVWIDEMILTEYDEQGKFLSQPLHLRFDSETVFARYSDSGEVSYAAPNAQGTGGCLYISSVQDGYAVLEEARVPVKTGHSYQLSFFIGGSGLSEECSVSPMLEFHSGSEPYEMNSAYLASLLKPYVTYANTRGLPLYVGGYGSMLSAGNHGAAQWTADLDALFEQYNIGSNYFIYRNDYYGIYKTDGTTNTPIRAYLASKAEG